MTCLHHFDSLLEFAPHACGRCCCQPDPHPPTSRDLTELAQLLAVVLRLAESAPPPWRPQTMEQWLT
jgi:hypothetical protein